MIAPVFDIDVKINNERVPTDTVTDLRQLYEYLGQFLKWLDDAPQFGKSHQSQQVEADVNVSRANEIFPTTNITEPSKTINQHPVIKTLNTTQYAILALGLNNGEASSIDAIKTAKEIGWYTRAKDEKNARRTFEIMIRQHQNLITLEKGMMHLTAEGWQEYARLTKPENDENRFAQDFINALFQQGSQPMPLNKNSLEEQPTESDDLENDDSQNENVLNLTQT